MAIVKATYTRQTKGAKASIRYIENRPGKDNQHITRPLFGHDGQLTRQEAYSMVDEAQKGSIFFRFVISPDPQKEDTQQDLHLREITVKTMQMLEKRIHKSVAFAAAIHDDHAEHRHVHVVAMVNGRLNGQDFQALRQEATTTSLEQRNGLDLARESRANEQDEQWSREHEYNQKSPA